METRKVISIKSSLFINIPASIAEELKLKKGDVLWVGKLSKDGLIVTKSKSTGKVEAGVAGIDRIRAVGEEVFSELRKKSKALENSFINNIMLRLTGVSMHAGVSDLKRILADSVERLTALEKQKKKAR
jgi:uncharacterized Zn finger protein